MAGSRFDAWTRRQFGLVAGGVAASFLDSARHTAARKGRKRKQRKRKRCQTLGATCASDVTRQCCGQLICEPFFGRLFCCNGEGQRCSSGGNECCQQELECVAGFCERAL